MATIKTRTGSKKADYKAYEIVYDVDGKKQRGWYSFHPLPDPDPEEIKDEEIFIIYKKARPYIFERVTE